MVEEFRSAEDVLEEWSSGATSKSPSTTHGQKEGDKRQTLGPLERIWKLLKKREDLLEALKVPKK